MDLTMTARKKQKRRLCVFLTLAGVLMLIGLLAPLIVPNDPNATNAANMNASPSAKYLFGTDRYGRCVFSRVLVGSEMCIRDRSSWAREPRYSRPLFLLR